MTAMTKTINIQFPISWRMLGDAQKNYLLFLHSEGYNPEKIRVHALLALGMTKDNGGRMIPVRQYMSNHSVDINTAELSQLANEKAMWTTELPDYPVRLDSVHTVKAKYDPYCNNLSFENWLAADNYMQGYFYKKDPLLLYEIQKILYPQAKHKRLITFKTFDAMMQMNIILWWGSLKRWLRGRFAHLFLPSPTQGQQGAENTHIILNAAEMQARMDDMLLALTGGDITKEKEVLRMPYQRAFTYLEERIRNEK